MKMKFLGHHPLNGPHKALDDTQLAAIAELFAVLSERSRLRILQVLQGGPANVGELVEKSGLKQANVSRQLGLLLSAGIIARGRRETSRSIRSPCRWCLICASWCATASPNERQSAPWRCGDN